ncbi:hypothetical protein DICSQDRAFT_155960 [Dichomitus squalens LYAD-421 SS1]|uniref:Uncharacterized protein n=1 Tax=Dichomitus squalens (strain LYAD-421) TaxID=732165 RepID=R7SW36_DICSQ|nr:uncharacterized protein DICSQDRAFT_155960 [Dichomitus squalens LYAD-421 SS1]EJF59980.1 hypothetical protein DICSQDRAFT_155960 [Dichomitus squalens LYAD-421 SS1]
MRTRAPSSSPASASCPYVPTSSSTPPTHSDQAGPFPPRPPLTVAHPPNALRPVQISSSATSTNVTSQEIRRPNAASSSRPTISAHCANHLPPLVHIARVIRCLSLDIVLLPRVRLLPQIFSLLRARKPSAPLSHAFGMSPLLSSSSVLHALYTLNMPILGTVFSQLVPRSTNACPRSS